MVLRQIVVVADRLPLHPQRLRGQVRREVGEPEALDGRHQRLKLVDGLTHAEISEVVGVPPGTVGWVIGDP